MRRGLRGVRPDAATSCSRRRSWSPPTWGWPSSWPGASPISGEPLDDLVQVASIGLLKALSTALDPDRGVEFSTYATTTIVGELKRHLRDKGWAVRAPRRMQELYLTLSQVVDTLGQELGRSPNIAVLAAEVQASEEDVLEALEAGQAYRKSQPPLTPLRAPDGEPPGAPRGADRPGATDELTRLPRSGPPSIRFSDQLPSRQRPSRPVPAVLRGSDSSRRSPAGSTSPRCRYRACSPAAWPSCARSPSNRRRPGRTTERIHHSTRQCDCSS